MPNPHSVAVLNLGQNGQVTVPSGFRKTHSLSKGGKLIAVEMGDALVMVPHDGVIESICMRLEQAMKGASLEVEDLQAEVLKQRAAIVRKRYGSPSRGR
jgi:bifunctional DNA-binding transcriptional regulator/antitoxin component of YhaV-PrlF toxin-antitoxin module